MYIHTYSHICIFCESSLRNICQILLYLPFAHPRFHCDSLPCPVLQPRLLGRHSFQQIRERPSDQGDPFKAQYTDIYRNFSEIGVYEKQNVSCFVFGIYLCLAETICWVEFGLVSRY